ncbi:MAG TPA: universal stress protein [Candidatus Limnocylindrales bacterium]
MDKILVAYDGGEPARRALETAAELAHALGATVSVVSVVPFHPGRTPVDPWDDSTVHAQELIEAKRYLLEQGIEPELIEPVGDPAPTIERIVAEGGYDTVILGSRGLGPISRALQGSVSEHVATHSRATVVIAH